MGAYVAQLLPDLEQARVLRDALTAYIARDDISEDKRDVALEMSIKLLQDMRRKH